MTAQRLSIGSGVVPDLPARTATAHVIRSDAEALAVADAVAADIARTAVERDRDRLFAHDEVERFSQSGLWGITVPREHGGAGVSRGTLAEVAARIVAADASLGQIPQNHWFMVEAIRLAATEAQKATWFDRVLRGDRLGNAYSEVGGKTQVDFRTTILPDGSGGYVLQGEKFYSTGALYAHWIVAVANDAEGRKTLVLVPRDAPGLTLVNNWTSFGQRATGSGTTRFEGVRVAADALVPHQDVYDRPTAMGPFAQIIHAAVQVGIARAALRDGLDFCRRHARPWFETDHARGADDPYVIHEAGDLAIRVHAADALLERAGGFVDAATADPTEDSVAAASVAVAQAKALGTEAAVHVASTFFELTGSRSTLDEFGLDRHWRNARTHSLHDPVRYKHVAIGRHLLNGERPARHGAI